MQFLGAFSILMTFSMAILNSANAESWDLGYTNSTPEVEAIPNSITDDPSSEITMTESAPEADQEKPPIHSAAVSSSITKISTARNTYGVETVEKPAYKLFLSPIAGFSSILGNGTVDVAPQYAFGGRVGLLISDNMMVEGGYTYSMINTSVPLNAMMGILPADVYSLKQSTMDLGAKFFFLGRESRFRPFIGGGFAYATSSFNYSAAYERIMGITDDFKMKQWQGMGQVGAEIAITRGIVVTAAFKVNGILSNNTTEAGNASSMNQLESGKAIAGSSLSHSASYMGSVGVGVYF